LAYPGLGRQKFLAQAVRELLGTPFSMIFRRVAGRFNWANRFGVFAAIQAFSEDLHIFRVMAFWAPGEPLTRATVRIMQRFLRTLFVTVLSAVAVSTCGFSPQKLVHRMTTTGPVSASPPVSSKEEFSATVDSSKLIYVIPMQGVPSSVGLVLADAIAATLRDAGKPAILSSLKNEMGPSVSGRIIAQEERGSVIWVTALWELLAPYGTVVAEYRQQVVVDKHLWREGSAEAINLLIADAGP